MGLVERASGRIRPCVGLVAVEDMVIARDRYDDRQGALHPDHVVGVNPPAMLLARLTVRARVARTLDLGCGGGVQAFLAARHSERVVASDVNPRALAYARFGARVNDLLNVEVRQGDSFGPVAGERFSLVLCNPPYVVSPDSLFAFRDAGRPGICEEIVRRAPEHLEEGGFAIVLCNWPLAAGEHWAEPPTRWVAGTGCDAWVLCGDTQDGLGYAAGWNRSADASAYGAALDRWLAHYRERGFSAIAMGAVVLRRRSGTRNWVRKDELSGRPEGPCGEQILRIFAAQDELDGLSDEALLARAYRVPDDPRLHQTLALRDGRLVVEDAELRLSGGFGFRGTVDAVALELLRRSDGRRTLAEIVADLGHASTPRDPSLSGAVAAAVRGLAGLGFLIPVTGKERRMDGSTREHSQETDAAAAGTLRVDGSARPGGGAA